MILDITSTGTEALQDSLVGRLRLGRDLCWSSRGGTYHTGTEASLIDRGNPSRAQGGGLVSISRLSSLPLALHFFPLATPCLCGGIGMGNGNSQLLSSRRDTSMNVTVRYSPQEQWIISLLCALGVFSLMFPSCLPLCCLPVFSPGE